MLVLLVLLVLALVAVGCTGGGGDDPSVGDRAAPTTTETPRPGGVLRVGIEAPRSLDPAATRSTSDAIAADLLYDGLTAVDADGHVVPALADRWQAAPDQTKWDFHVRADARFADGQPVTPDAVVASFARVRTTGADLLKSGLAVVRTITAPAPDLVHLELTEPFADLPALLSNPGYGVVAPGWTPDAPRGSGPFRFERRDGDVLHLVRADSATPAPYLDGVDLHLADTAESFQAFKDGELDVSLVPPSASDEAAELAGRTGFVPYVAEVFYGFNLKNPKFADARLREAIVHAVDRTAIGEVVYGGAVAPIDGPVPRGLPAFQRNPCGNRCEHDADRAKRLLAEAFPAGGATPPEIAIDFDADPTQESVAKALQANLAAVGITATLRPHPVGEYANVVGRGEQELFRLGWVGLYPAADAFLTPLFRGGSETNVTGFAVPAVDEVLRAARAEPHPAARVERFRDAERRIMDMVPIIPIAQFQTLSVANRQVRGLAFTPLGSFDGASVWLAGS